MAFGIHTSPTGQCPVNVRFRHISVWNDIMIIVRGLDAHSYSPHLSICVMNSRERVLAAARHRIPDRVPVDLGGMRSTTISAMAYAALKDALEIRTGGIFVFDPYLQLAYVEEPVRRRFGCDVVLLNGNIFGGWRPTILPNGFPAKVCDWFRCEPDGLGGEYAIDPSGRRTWHRPASSYYFDPVYWPLAEARTAADLAAYHWPLYTDETLKQLQTQARQLCRETDYAIIGSTGGNFLEAGQWARGYEQFMLDLAADPGFATALMDNALENHLANAELYLQAVGDEIQILQMDDDLGAQNAPQIHPRLYYEMIQPRQKGLWQRMHELRPEIPLFLHSCGSIADLIPGLIDAGLDILNPVQITAKGMDPASLKARFGDRLCFWGGGCDTQHVLPFGTPEDVYEHTRRNVEILKPGGGFVFAAIHNIQAGVPPENIIAMFQAVQDAGKYEAVGEDQASC